ncbi:MAG TPA: transglutaminaseTgpA domain-containing protein, partial [Acidimicrobiia bacterium]
ALSLGRLLDSARFVGPVIGAALLPHALGALVRRVRIPTVLAVAIGGLALILYVTLALERSTATFGFPNGATWDAFERQLDSGWNLLRTQTAPAHTTNGAVLLAVLATWFVATLADFLAFRPRATRATLAAVAPALVLFVWTSTLGTADDRTVTTAAFCAATGTFLLFQHLALLDRRRSWLVSQEAGSGHLLAPAAVLGAIALVAGLLVAPQLPGAGADPLLDFVSTARSGAGGRSYRTNVAPFVDIGAKLQHVGDVELFTVAADTPDYWRIAALDDYTNDSGGQWTLRADGHASVTVGLPPTGRSSTGPPGTVRQDFRITQLGERWLPAAYRAVAISLPDTLVVDASTTLVTQDATVRGLHYRVESTLPPLAAASVTPEQQGATAVAVPKRLRRYLRLPADLPPAIADTAQHVIDQNVATTPFAKAAALRDFFRSTAFTYDTRVPPFDDGNAIVQFLQNKRGFCVQFASAYAVMARSLGIPARVAVGFTHGTLEADGRYHVTGHDAHAWPEIWLAGIGWTHFFDPTPVSTGGRAGGSTLTGEQVKTAAGPTATTSVPTTTSPPSGPRPTASATGSAQPDVSAASPGSTARPWLLVLGLVGALLLGSIGYAAIVITAKARRRTRRRRTPEPDGAVYGAWEEALDRLREADLTPDPASTPLET